MTNYEMLMDLPQEELAWFLMNNVTCNECSLCAYRYIKEEYELCSRVPEGAEVERPDNWSCVEGHLKWLKQEPTERDLRLFYVCKHNVAVEQYNNMSNENRMMWDLVYGNAAGDQKYATDFKESKYSEYLKKWGNHDNSGS